MKKNNTLKIVLAMLVVVLVSLVAFGGVYQGRKLLKGNLFGSDFKAKQVATYKVEEEKKSEEKATDTAADANKQEENSAEPTNAPEPTKTAEEKSKMYKEAKNKIENRLRDMQVEEFLVRLNEDTGNLAIEIPNDADVAALYRVVNKGTAEIQNQNTKETIIGNNGFKNITAKLETVNTSVPTVIINIEFTNEAKNTFRNVNPNYKDDSGTEQEATFAFILNGQTLYTDSANSFIETAKNGNLNLNMTQTKDQEKLDKSYKEALTLAAVIKSGELPVAFNVETVQYVQNEVNYKAIIVTAIVIGAILFVIAVLKFKTKAILPCLSLIGYVASLLLVLIPANVKLTWFSVMGIAIVTIINYAIIIQSISNDKKFMQNFVKTLSVLLPCLIAAVVFCCAPYLELASLGVIIFWGVIVMFVYDVLITRVLVNK